MSRLTKRRLALLTALLAMLAGGATGALGSSGGGGRTKTAHAHSGKRVSLLSVAAGYLGLPEAQIRSELHSGKSLAQIAEASSGHTSGGLIAALVGSRSAHLSERITTLVSSPGGAKHAAKKSARTSARAVALAYLGLSRNEARSRLRAGRSLGEIADATPGRSASGLIDAIVANAAQHSAPKPAAGHLSKSAQTARLARIRKRVSAVVARKHFAAKPSH
jgi:hypothetical protein